MPKKDEIQLSRAKTMRTNPTDAEQRLWHHLRGKRLNGIKFTRQVLIGPYIVDFAARLQKLVIELDGDTHGHQVDYDRKRTAFLEGQGFHVLRFTNGELRDNLEGVLTVIAQQLDSSSLPGPLPLGEREI
jgi:very-short-patch-repair endonuclease